MNSTTNLKSLENLLENFLDKAVAKKEKQLLVMEGIGTLNDIVRKSERGIDITDEAGDWFASHSTWLTEPVLKTGDIKRIESILSNLQGNMSPQGSGSAAEKKIYSEINRWDKTLKNKQPAITLKRPPEQNISEIEDKSDTIALFIKKLSKITAMFIDFSANKAHILSILDNLLKTASFHLDKDALLLSGFIIYYLKQNGYKVEPYVKRLKEAEKSIGKRTSQSATRR